MNSHLPRRFSKTDIINLALSRTETLYTNVHSAYHHNHPQAWLDTFRFASSFHSCLCFYKKCEINLDWFFPLWTIHLEKSRVYGNHHMFPYIFPIFSHVFPMIHCQGSRQLPSFSPGLSQSQPRGHRHAPAEARTPAAGSPRSEEVLWPGWTILMVR